MIDYEETKSQPISRKMVWQAYGQVRANKGCAGIDEMDWEYFDKNRSTLIYKLWNRLTSGSYFPQACSGYLCQPEVKNIHHAKVQGNEHTQMAWKIGTYCTKNQSYHTRNNQLFPQMAEKWYGAGMDSTQRPTTEMGQMGKGFWQKESNCISSMQVQRKSGLVWSLAFGTSVTKLIVIG